MACREPALSHVSFLLRFVSNPTQTVKDLRSLYPDLEDIDLYVGALAEGTVHACLRPSCSRMLGL